MFWWNVDIEFSIQLYRPFCFVSDICHVGEQVLATTPFQHFTLHGYVPLVLSPPTVSMMYNNIYITVGVDTDWKKLYSKHSLFCKIKCWVKIYITNFMQNIILSSFHHMYILVWYWVWPSRTIVAITLTIRVVREDLLDKFISVYV